MLTSSWKSAGLRNSQYNSIKYLTHCSSSSPSTVSQFHHLYASSQFRWFGSLKSKHQISEGILFNFIGKHHAFHLYLVHINHRWLITVHFIRNAWLNVCSYLLHHMIKQFHNINFPEQLWDIQQLFAIYRNSVFSLRWHLTVFFFIRSKAHSLHALSNI